MGKSHSTNRVNGLDVSTSPDLIEPSSLTKSEGGWTSKDGVWSAAAGHSAYGNQANQTDLSGICAGRMGGADHVVWVEGSNLYDNDVDQGAITTGSTLAIHAVDDKFLFLGADKNYIYDGNHIRQQGAWQPQRRALAVGAIWDVKNAGTGTQLIISDISKEATCELTVTTSPVSASYDVGDWLYIDGVIGMTELNGRVFRISAMTASTIDIDVDSQSYSTYGSDGQTTLNACGLFGKYKYYYTCIVKLSDDKVLESTPRACRIDIPDDEHGYAGEAEVLNLSPTDVVQLQIAEYWENGNNAPTFDMEISGTIETDYTPGFRLYRTKSGGATFQQEHEWYYDSGAYTPGSGGGIARTTGTGYEYFKVHSDADSGIFAHYSAKRDVDLGAVYVPGNSDLATPPQATLAATMGLRLWTNNVDEPDQLHFTHLKGIDYGPTLGWIRIPDAITGLAAAGDTLIVFSTDRIFRVTLFGGIPDLQELKTPVGTTYGNAIASTDLGVLFLRDDGLWVTNGMTAPDKVSRVAFPTIGTPYSVVTYGDIVFVCGSSAAYVANRTNTGMYWHEVKTPFDLSGVTTDEVFISASNDKLYMAEVDSIHELFSATANGGVLESKYFTDGSERRAITVWVDVKGGYVAEGHAAANPTILLNGNRVSSAAARSHVGTETMVDDEMRRLLRYEIGNLGFGSTGLLNHVFWLTLNMSTDHDIFGFGLEVE